MAPPVSAESALDAALPAPAERVAELSAVWRPFWTSRLLVLLAGSLAALSFGVPRGQWVLDPSGVASSLGRVGSVLAAPAVRWDAIHYLQIAQHGYQSGRDAAFYPLYPILIRAVSLLTHSLVIAGVLISLGSMLAAMLIIRRLTELELGDRVANVTTQLLAFGPMAVFLSAVYTESLFLALSAGTIYAARRGRWAQAGVLGCFAAMERSSGALLLVPVLMLYFYGPRADATAPRPAARWRPRYPLRADALWSMLIPLGAAAVGAYWALRGFGLTAGVHAQEQYQHHDLTLPFVVLWQAVVAAWHQLTLLQHGGWGAFPDTNQALFQLGALCVTCVLMVGVFRRLPLAYGVYSVLGLAALHLSAPTPSDPLAGFARYASLRFPLFMVAAAWAVEHGRSRALVAVCAVAMVAVTAQFSSWHVVGSLYL
jgi:Mannosyltransferase (PIG-V)